MSERGERTKYETLARVWANVRVRKFGAAAVAVLAVAGLSSCDSKVGQAAVVDGHRLSDSNLSGYVQAGAKSYADPNSGKSVVPKLQALDSWIIDRIVEDTVEAHGGPVTPAELSRSRSIALGKRTIGDLTKVYSKQGFTDRFAELLLHEQQMVVLLAKRLVPTIADSQILSALSNQQFGSKIVTTVQQSHPAVSLSARYGAWDAKNLTLIQTRGAGLPSFITFGAPSAPGATG